MMRSLLSSTAVAFALLAGAAAEAADALVLLRSGQLVPVDLDRLTVTGPARAPKGADGRLLALDLRPKDGRVYAVSDTGGLHRLDPATGTASRIAGLGQPIVLSDGLVLDFNPVADRMRVIDPSGGNYRVNPDSGEVVVDGRIGYAAASDGKRPVLVAGAYVNSMAGAKETALYTVDAAAAALNLQAPPNDGVQKPRGALGMPVGSAAAFDIRVDAAGRNRALLLVGTTLYDVETETGRSRPLGRIKGLTGEVADLVLLPTAG
jgi:hypothetical protein